ncbi:MAG: hypothetical protein DF168_02014 [Candidatus Moanabacter tarae]|uniref:Uncharacterized protein n=1 Tax=Candidatus Moanibacter tarae TaxID=2200854 RepID=A0A2Z4AK16_9BACT|nr:MAG: hypothetical protein DF168_02014 [Candidatus Moanabacter tarae]
MGHQQLGTISSPLTPQKLNVLALDLTHQFLHSPPPVVSVQTQTNVSPYQAVGLQVDITQTFCNR